MLLSSLLQLLLLLADSCFLSPIGGGACSPRWTNPNINNHRAVVCGSPYEVANNPVKTNTLSFTESKPIYVYIYISMLFRN